MNTNWIISDKKPPMLVPISGSLIDLANLVGIFALVLIVMGVLLYVLRRRLKVENENLSECSGLKKWSRILGAIAIIVLMLIVWCFGYMFIAFCYGYRLYSITYSILITSLCIITMICMLSKSEKSLNFGKILLLICSILVLSNVLFYTFYAKDRPLYWDKKNGGVYQQLKDGSIKKY